ncbi:hypothetical protein IMAU10049_01785 [Lactobacillus helveticus]|nr:hypothetical protein [Lactobacillus helveticus]
MDFYFLQSVQVNFTIGEKILLVNIRNLVMIIDTKKLQKAIIENKKNHNFNTTDIKFELLCLYGEVMSCFKLG